MFEKPIIQHVQKHINHIETYTTLSNPIQNISNTYTTDVKTNAKSINTFTKHVNTPV